MCFLFDERRGGYDFIDLAFHHLGCYMVRKEWGCLEGVKPNPMEVVQRIKAAVNDFNLALSVNVHVVPRRGMQNRGVEWRPDQLANRFLDCLFLGWHRSKYKTWLAATWFKQGVAYRWSGKCLNAHSSKSMSLLIFIRDLFIDLFDLTNDLCVGIPSKLVVNVTSQILE